MNFPSPTCRDSSVEMVSVTITSPLTSLTAAPQHHLPSSSSVCQAVTRSPFPASLQHRWVTLTAQPPLFSLENNCTGLEMYIYSLLHNTLNIFLHNKLSVNLRSCFFFMFCMTFFPLRRRYESGCLSSWLLYLRTVNRTSRWVNLGEIKTTERRMKIPRTLPVLLRGL